MNKKIKIYITLFLLLILTTFIVFYIKYEFRNLKHKNSIEEQRIKEELLSNNDLNSEGKIKENKSTEKNVKLEKEIIKDTNKTEDNTELNIDIIEAKDNESQIEESVQSTELNMDLENLSEDIIINDDDYDISFEDLDTEETDEIIYDYESFETEFFDDLSYYNEIYNEKVTPFIRTDIQSEVVADVVFLNFFIEDEKTKDYYIFDIYFNTHSYGISEKDLNKKIELINDNKIKIDKNIIWEPQVFTEGHHVSGRIYIPKKMNENEIINDKTEFVKMIMNNTAGADIRIFEWNKKDIDFKSLIN